MPPVISAGLAYLASWFQSRHVLQMEILALRHQLAVYQHSVKRPQVRSSDRLFWAWLSRLWPGWQRALAFCQPRTVIAWQKKRFRDYWRRVSQRGKPGRPAMSKEVVAFIRDMWRCNPTWGSPRIVGELHKIGLDVAKSTVEKYRPHVSKPSSPTWKAFLNNHVQDLVSCDFFTVPTASFRVLFVFIILAHDRRRIRRECLDDVMVLNERHLCRIVQSYVDYYHTWRVHRALDMDAPEPRPVQPPGFGPVRKLQEVGGLHHHYERIAA